MKITLDKDSPELEEFEGPVGRFLKNLKKQKPPKHWLLVKQTLLKAKEKESLDFLEATGGVIKLTGCKEPIFEFRIPPTMQGGVVRIYFAYNPNDRKEIWLFSAELKKDKKPDETKIEIAEKRYRELFKK